MSRFQPPHEYHRGTSRQSSHGSNHSHQSYNHHQNNNNHHQNNNNQNNNNDRSMGDEFMARRSRRYQSHRSTSDSSPSQGRVISLLESFGFLQCVDRMEDVFFHYSEVLDQTFPSGQPEIGDEVQFQFYTGRRGGGGGGNNGTGGEKKSPKAVRVEYLPPGTVVWEEERGEGLRLGQVVQLPMSTTTASGRMRDGGRGENGPSAAGGGGGGEKSREACGIMHLFPPSATLDSIHSKNSQTDVGEEVLFSLEDLQAIQSRKKLGQKDVLQFRLVYHRRFACLFARDIELVQSHRERLAAEREEQLLQTAVEARAVVLSVQGEFAMLRSASYGEGIHVHVSNVIVTGNKEGKEGGMEKKGSMQRLLSPGCQVKCLVVDEDTDVGGGSASKNRHRWTARQVQRLSEDEEKLEIVDRVAVQVEGTVLTLPRFASSADVSEVEFKVSSLHDLDFRGGIGGGVAGKITLHSPLSLAGGKEKEEEELLKEVEFYPEDAPGGVRVISTSNRQYKLGSWVQCGDVLRFDVVREVTSGNTTRLRAHPCLSSCKEEGKKDRMYLSLLEANLPGRTEGTISTLKPDVGYGFIRLAERPVDAYFRISDVLPSTTYSSTFDGKDVYKHKGELQVGMPVSFDLSLASQSSSSTARQEHARENIKGTRVALLGPPHSQGVMLYKTLAKGRKARVTKKHGNGSGMLELLPDDDGANNGSSSSDDAKAAGEETASSKDGDAPEEKEAEESKLDETQSSPKDEKKKKAPNSAKKRNGPKINGMSLDERHPLICKLLNRMQGKDGGPGLGTVVFPHALPKHETDVIQNMAESRGLIVEEEGGSGGAEGGGRRGVLKLINGALVPRPPVETSQDETDPAKDGAEESEVGTAPPAASQGAAKKKAKKLKPKPIPNNIRFERNSVVQASFDALPSCSFDLAGPQEGDIVLCDVRQFRTTGQADAVQITLVERTASSPTASSNHLESKSGVGVVTELVASRHFGFISTVVVDGPKKEASFREKLFFHFDKVLPKEKKDDAGGGGQLEGEFAATEEGGTAASTSEDHGGGALGSKREAVITKGDEVRFDITTSNKNGKRVAVNIVILSPGTLPKVVPVAPSPKKEDKKNLCEGYVLMEPSHTSLATTSSGGFKNSTGPAAAGRWSKVNLGDDKPKPGSNTMLEDGCILLLHDPNCVFGGGAEGLNMNGNGKEKKEKAAPASPGKDEEASKGGDASDKSDGEGVIETITKEASSPSSVVISDNKEEVATATNKEAKAVSSVLPTHVHYKNAAVASSFPTRRHNDASSLSSAPRRGDLVSFHKAKGARGAKDVKVVKKAAAKLVRGKLEKIDLEKQTIVFVTEDAAHSQSFECSLKEVVSCSPKVLKVGDAVEGILHENAIFGVSRTADLYLVSKVAGGKERPRLNLTVRKELKGLGGKIMAQSGMAKGPDGTNGFAEGWTKRVSPYSSL